MREITYADAIREALSEEMRADPRVFMLREDIDRDTMFDDMLAATPTAIKSRGRMLWAIDWSDINIGVSQVRSVTRQTNVADDVYNCVIQPNVNHYQLNSKRICVMVQDPNRHVIFENFSGLCPSITAQACAEYA